MGSAYYCGYGMNQNPRLKDTLNAFMKQEPISKEDLEFLLVAENQHINEVLASSLHTPLWVLEKLVIHKNFNVKMKVAQNPNMPSFLLKKMYQLNSHQSVLNAIGTNPNTPVEVLKSLIAQDICTGVAGNPSTPVPLLENLYTMDQWAIRQSLANNPNVPLKILLRLASDETYVFAAASNRSIPVPMLEKWAAEGDGLVLESVAINPSSTEEILLKVFERSFEFKPTRNRAKPSGDRIREELVNNHSTTAAVLSGLAEDEEPVIRQLVARHKNTSFATLTKFLNDEDFDVVELASNRITSLSSENFKDGLKEIDFELDGLDSLPRDWVLKILKDFNPKN